ncbi:alpha/beta hydrolase [Antrihabitans cavernicola]|uniref:Alpha/beta hydrolase n=1 Tax=Antrihabitans cavernicola TaxID=2495913 RepID=A0A5A7S4B3_9NOCA|nr:alpha/beta hydrolase [Spelaeibacter cavernicola]KAA0016776.1 alpha/beta hydrolase [Spelaeibacter cavernicola]
MRRRLRVVVRGIVASCASALLVTAGGATAVAEPPPVADTPTTATQVDPLYMLFNALMLLEGYQRDFTPASLQFWAEHLLSLPGRVGESLQHMLDPAQYQGPDGQLRLRDNVQKLIDDTAHLNPTLVGASTLPANPDYLPNWSNNGRFGTAADSALDSDALDVAHAGNVGLTAKFRYPCTAADGSVTYETRSGACVPGNPPGADFKYGEARKIQIVNSRGMRLAATLWLPEQALQPGNTKKFPMTVFTDGVGSIQSSYYLYTMTAVRHGYIGLTYDEAGQGSSDGTALDLVVPYNTPHCFASGPCRDIEDVMHWAVGDDVVPSVDLNSELPDGSSLGSLWNTLRFPRIGQRYNPAYAPAGMNVRNPVLDKIDVDRIGVWGHSLGSVATSHYLWDVGRGHGMDGRPLPKPAAAVLLSGVEPTNGDVPTQTITADLDIPGITSGSVFPINDIYDPTDGPIGTKSWYDWVRDHGTGHAPLEFLTIKGGSHFDTQDLDFIYPQTLESRKTSSDYALAWFDCNIEDVGAACTQVVTPTTGLSESVAAEFAPNGGPGPSYCLNVPTKQSLETAIAGPIRAALDLLYNEPQPHPCVAGQPIPIPHAG